MKKNNIQFDLFEYYCNTIFEWYPKNIENICSNNYVYNSGNHIENINTINIIVNDIEENREEYIKLMTSPRIKRENPMMSENEIFIVHGHDDGLKNEVARFIEKLDLKPIILHEQASGGATIIEKIENYTNVGFGIVLYTPCDVGSTAKDSKNLKARARQNVIFEHGYLIGKLGRQNVVALVKDDVEKPNDISGVVYINYSNSEGWKTDIVKELKGVGYSIDLNKLF